jgi:radical SAM protein with 4Fe4S-binding SPASM domain
MLDVSRLLCRAEEVSARVAAGTGEGRGDRFAAAKRPVVVWNVTRRCNLHCAHCYAAARTRPSPDELESEVAHALIRELGRCRVPALILSGGDPLLRPDLPDLVRAASQQGIHVAVSTNGTLIDAPVARSLRAAGAGYVGVSVDGIGALHDRFRGLRGAFERALRGLRHCRDAGLAVGLRLTLSRPTLPHLERVLDLMEEEGVPRGYVSHLVYVGRAGRLAPSALTKRETRTAVDAILDRAEALAASGSPLSLVTGNSDADGVHLYLRVRARRPRQAPLVHELLRRRGGNSAGVAIASIDDRGEVHPDQFWPHHSLGNVRTRRFGDIWADPGEPLLARLRDRRAHVRGRCARCPFFALCGGGSRVRAEALTGDLWGSDPACYLTDAELGLEPHEEPSDDANRPDEPTDPARGAHHPAPDHAAPRAGR